MFSKIKRFIHKKSDDRLKEDLEILLQNINLVDLQLSQRNSNGMSMLVATYKNLRFIIRPNESGPHMYTPHFHVETDNKAASYKLEDCTRLAGKLPKHVETEIHKFWREKKSDLWRRWKRSRPTNIYCTLK